LLSSVKRPTCGFTRPETMDPVERAKGALAEARGKGFDTVIVDTAGRLHIDDDLMDELQQSRRR
jgi:signal recognition particle subunit SRP54